jgi:hypothetical protein
MSIADPRKGKKRKMVRGSIDVDAVVKERKTNEKSSADVRI